MTTYEPYRVRVGVGVRVRVRVRVWVGVRVRVRVGVSVRVRASPVTQSLAAKRCLSFPPLLLPFFKATTTS